MSERLICPPAAYMHVPQHLEHNALAAHDGIYLMTSGGHVGDSVVYQWRQHGHRHSVTGPPAYLFRATNGAWVVGPRAGANEGSIQSNDFDAQCPASASSWAYYEGAPAQHWQCTASDQNCTNGSGITVEPRCTERSYNASLHHRSWTVTPCPSPPPSTPPIPASPLTDRADFYVYYALAAGLAVLLIAGMALVRTCRARHWYRVWRTAAAPRWLTVGPSVTRHEQSEQHHLQMTTPPDTPVPSPMRASSSPRSKWPSEPSPVATAVRRGAA